MKYFLQVQLWLHSSSYVEKKVPPIFLADNVKYESASTSTVLVVHICEQTVLCPRSFLSRNESAK